MATKNPQLALDTRRLEAEFSGTLIAPDVFLTASHCTLFFERDLAPASMFIDVTTIDEMAKLAERHNTVILHMKLNFLHYYLVQYGGITYRYVFSTGRRGLPEIEPPRRQIIDYVTDLHPAQVAEARSGSDDLFEYVINQRRTAKTEVTDTVVLKKVRL